MTRPEDPQALLFEMARISRKYVLIFVPNRMNYAFWLHRLHHCVACQRWDHGRIDLMHANPWRDLFAKANLRVKQTFHVDCPWWPDIVDAGQLIRDFFPFLKGLARHLPREPLPLDSRGIALLPAGSARRNPCADEPLGLL